MITKSLYVRAFALPGSPDALPDELTFGELAELRATSLDGIDHELMRRLLNRLEMLAATGRLPTVSRTVERFTGRFYEVREVRHTSFGPVELERIKVEYLMGGAPAGAVPVMHIETVAYVPREAALALHAQEPDDWGDGALRWAGAARVKAVARQTLTPAMQKPLAVKAVSAKEMINILEGEGFNRNATKPKFDHVAAYPWLSACLASHGKYSVEATLKAFVDDSPLIQGTPDIPPRKPLALAGGMG